MRVMKKCIPWIVLLIVFLLVAFLLWRFGAVDRYPLTEFWNTRVVSDSPPMYIDMAKNSCVGELTLEDGTTQKIELKAMHGSFLIFKFREDHQYGADDATFFKGDYRIKGDTLVLEDENGTEISLRK